MEISRASPARALIVVADARGSTMSIANALRDRLRHRGHAVEVGDSQATATPTNAHYDAVIIGTQLGQARDRQLIYDYIARNREALSRLSTGLVVVHGSRSHTPRHHIDAFSTALCWRPNFSASLEYRRPGRVRSAVRYALVMMLRQLTGSHDTSSLDEVSELADTISREVQRHKPAT
jgi:menaquinone-dependent protoporphyrinogen IX oxidase